MLMLFKNERPMVFFGLVALVLALVSVGLAAPIFVTYMQTGLVPRFPTAILSVSVMLLAFLSMVCGLILDTVTRGRREMKRLAYLQIPAPLARMLQTEAVLRGEERPSKVALSAHR
jgi:hypothetical protein